MRIYFSKNKQKIFVFTDKNNEKFYMFKTNFNRKELIDGFRFSFPLKQIKRREYIIIKEIIENQVDKIGQNANILKIIEKIYLQNQKIQEKFEDENKRRRELLVKEEKFWEEQIKERMNPINGKVNFPLGELTPIYLCKKHPYCQNEGHIIENVRAKIMSIDKERIVEINIFYCPKHREYFIGKKSFDMYQKIYGRLEYKINPDYGYKDSRDLSSLNTESLLHIFGYNVLKKENLSDLERQTILVKIIEYRDLSLYDIISHIEFLINLNENNSNQILAVAKWKDDLLFLNDYDRERQREIFGIILQKSKKYKKDLSYF